MTPAGPESGKFVPPSIHELTLRVLARGEGIEGCAAVSIGDVEPHEVAVALRTEPRQAWQEGLAVLKTFVAAASTDIGQPGEWASLITRRVPAHALPFALCNYPQQVRDLSALIEHEDLSGLLKTEAETPSAGTGLRNWANQQIRKGAFPQALIGAALFRAAGDHAAAGAALQGLKGTATAEWWPAVENEEAALLWERGERLEALKAWLKLPENPAVLFNCGMACLFLNRPAQAREHLKKAVAGLSDTDPWHHLGSLYLALAEMRG
jgi:tetratricopeptide (TPR) repeat protein